MLHIQWGPNSVKYDAEGMTVSELKGLLATDQHLRNHLNAPPESVDPATIALTVNGVEQPHDYVLQSGDNVQVKFNPAPPGVSAPGT